MHRQMVQSVHTNGSQRISRVPTIQHGNKGGISHPRLAQHIQITVIRSASAAASTSYWSGGTSSEPGGLLVSFSKVSYC